MKRQKTDWFVFTLHFVCGAVVGALLGLVVWGRPQFELYDSWTAGAICIGGGALLFGLAAGLYKEGFWDDFRP